MIVLERTGLNEPRWRAEVDYRADSGIVTVTHDMEELEELQDLIERGPNFYTIAKMVIYPQGPCASETLTIEESLKE